SHNRERFGRSRRRANRTPDAPTTRGRDTNQHRLAGAPDGRRSRHCVPGLVGHGSAVRFRGGGLLLEHPHSSPVVTSRWAGCGFELTVFVTSRWAFLNLYRPTNKTAVATPTPPTIAIGHRGVGGICHTSMALSPTSAASKRPSGDTRQVG